MLARISAHGGRAWIRESPLPTDDNFNTPTKAGFTVGGFAGYNFVYGPLVFGPEANLQLISVEGSSHAAYMTQAISADAILSVNARAGYAIGNVLPYATIGLSKAWYDYNYSYDDDIAPSFTFKDSRTGWNIGAGIDAAITNNIFARAEYRYYNFRTEKFTGGWSEKYQQHTATVGIGYKF